MEKVNIIIGTFNRPNILGSTVEKFLNQTFQDINILICDNGDNPETKLVSEDIMSQDKRVSYKNSAAFGKGVINNRNFGIISVNKEIPYTFLTDDDDFPSSIYYLKEMYNTIKRGNYSKGNYDLFAYSPQLVKKDDSVLNIYTKIDESLAIQESLDSGYPNLPAKGMLFNTKFLKKYPLSYEYNNTGEDYGLFIDTLLELKKRGLYPAYTENVTAQYFLNESANKLIKFNKNYNPYFITSRDIIRNKYLKYLDYKEDRKL